MKHAPELQFAQQFLERVEFRVHLIERRLIAFFRGQIDKLAVVGQALREGAECRDGFLEACPFLRQFPGLLRVFPQAGVG